MLALAKDPITSSKGAKEYFEKDNYYLSEGTDREWQGKGAEALGLPEEIQLHDFQQILEGNMPTGEAFIGDTRKNMARDYTFSAPKSLSILALKDSRLLEAHRQAVQLTLEMMEKEYAGTRIGTTGKNLKEVQTGNLIIAKFHHTTSREQDPQTHTHCVIMNATLANDGKWRALDEQPLFANKMYAGQYYRNILSSLAKDMGYQIEAKDKGLFEIKGVPEELLHTYSKRREQVLAGAEAMKAEMNENIDPGHLNDLAARSTRRAKDKNVSIDSLMDRWETEAKDKGYDLNNVWNDTMQQPKSIELGKYEAIKKVVEVLSENESLLTREQILKGAMELSYTSSPEELERALTYLVNGDSDIIQLDKRTFTTRQLEAAEEKILKIAEDSTENGRTINEDYDMLKHSNLTVGQTTALDKILTTKDGLVLIQGYAGVGKTTMLEAVRSEAMAAGWKVQGAAFTGAAAGEMQDVGIPSQTVTSFLNNKSPVNNDKTLLIIDEASMVGTIQALEILEYAHKTGAKVVFLGDTAQLQAIAAGRSFKMLQERSGLETVEIKEIKRQRTDDYKAIVNQVVEKKTGPVLDKLQMSGQLSEVADMQAGIKAAAQEYNEGALILASTNKERRELNQVIRTELEAKGVIEKDSQTYSIWEDARFDGIEKNKISNYKEGDIIQASNFIPGMKKGAEAVIKAVDYRTNHIYILQDKKGKLETVSIDVSRSGDKLNIYRPAKLELATGDKVIFTNNDKDLNVKNGNTGVVTSIKKDIIKVMIKNGEIEREVEVNTKEYPFLDHGYAMTVHKSQGKSVEKVVILANSKSNIDYNSFYVGVTRGKEELKIITDNIPKIREKVQHEDNKLSIIEHKERKGLSENKTITRF